jgi:hypothetical protein
VYDYNLLWVPAEYKIQSWIGPLNPICIISYRSKNYEITRILGHIG